MRERSDWIWQSRWRQIYFVLGTVIIVALLGLVIDGRLSVGLVAVAAVCSLGGLLRAGRRRQV